MFFGGYSFVTLFPTLFLGLSSKIRRIYGLVLFHLPECRHVLFSEKRCSQRAGTLPVRKGRERDVIVQDGEEKGLGRSLWDL